MDTLVSCTGGQGAPLAIQKAEACEGEPAITLMNRDAIQRVLEEAGVKFTNGDQPSVKLKKQEAK